MVLLGDEAELEARFGPFGVSANLQARSVHGLRRTYHKLILVRLQIVLILTQDRCTVCAERIIGSENILDAPDETPR